MICGRTNFLYVASRTSHYSLYVMLLAWPLDTSITTTYLKWSSVINTPVSINLVGSCSFLFMDHLHLLQNCWEQRLKHQSTYSAVLNKINKCRIIETIDIWNLCFFLLLYCKPGALYVSLAIAILRYVIKLNNESTTFIEIWLVEQSTTFQAQLHQNDNRLRQVA